MGKAKRIEGTIRKLTGDTIPHNLVFFDTETFVIRSENGRIDFPFRLGHIRYLEITSDCQIKKQASYDFFSEDDMSHKFIELVEKKKKINVFAHNVAFDIRVLGLIHYLGLMGFESEPPIINQLVFSWELKKEDKKIIFLDTANLGVRSVESLGKDLGYEKMSVDFDSVTDEELLNYCKRDVEILEKFVYEYLKFIYKNKLGSFKITLAAQSLAALRTSFMETDMFIHSHSGTLQLERDAYSGGRTECFRLGYIGQQDYYYLDVNSMYPSAMINFDLPNRLCGYSEKIDKHELKYLMNNFYVLADVTINTQSNAYALKLSNSSSDYNYLHNPKNVYYPNTSSRRLIFPIGRFRQALHHEELKLAMKEKSIVKIHRVAWYERENPFNGYINFFYDAKAKYGKEGNKTWRMIAKLFLNSLYGKFGQLEPYREKVDLDLGYEYGRMPFYIDSADTKGQVIAWNGQTYIEYKKGETPFSNPSLAGAITANARMILYYYIKEAGKENVFYCDTDSLIVNTEGYRNLEQYIDDNKLGYLGLERLGRRLIIRGNKDYRLDNAKRFKGLPKSAVKINQNQWKYDKFEGFISWLNNNATNGAIGQIMFKRRISEYNKAIVLPDNSIIPYVLAE